MPNKKSKPKQRTNWKQRALHCEEVIGVLNALMTSREATLDDVTGLRYWQDRAAETRGELEQMAARAESAEKHNALLLEEREAKAANRTFCSGCLRQECHGECMAPVRFHGEAIRPKVEQEPCIHDPIAARGKCRICDDLRVVDYMFGENRHKPDQKDDPKPDPTHWQRFKSFLKHWYVELLCLMVVICAVIGFVAFAWWKA